MPTYSRTHVCSVLPNICILKASLSLSRAYWLFSLGDNADGTANHGSDRGQAGPRGGGQEDSQGAGQAKARHAQEGIAASQEEMSAQPSLRVVDVHEITITIVTRRMFPPGEPPVIVSNTFTSTKGSPMAQRTGTVQLSGAVDPTVTSIPVTITGSTVAGQSPITIDAFTPPGGTPNSFQCNDGDSLSEIAVQINKTGTSPQSATVLFTVAAGVVAPTIPGGGIIPVAPVIASNTFV
jgi:hypothetical protein